MTVNPSQRCGGCGRLATRPRAWILGTAYCATCYRGRLVAALCSSCGANTRWPRDGGHPLCGRCRVRGMPCIRCGQPMRRLGLSTAAGVACPACARYYRPPGECAYCGGISRHLARDRTLGLEEPACERCRRAHHRCCAGCGKHRAPAGQDAQGRPVCRRCLGQEPFVCPQCGQAGQRHSAQCCVPCYWRRYGQGQAARFGAALPPGWAQEAYGRFAADLLAESAHPQGAALRLKGYAAVFGLLQGLFAVPARVSTGELLKALEPEGLRRHRVPLDWLFRAGLLPRPDRRERLAWAEERRQKAILMRSEGQWHHGYLARLYAYLQATRELHLRYGLSPEQAGYAPRTLTGALRAAEAFLGGLPAERFASQQGLSAPIRQLTQADIDRFTEEHPGYRVGIRAFMRFLAFEVRLFQRLRPGRDLRPTKHLLLTPARCRDLTQGWLAAEGAAAKPALIGLLMLYYGLPVRRIITLTTADLQSRPGGELWLSAGSVPIPLDEPIAALARRYLETRRALSVFEKSEENPWLFPGQSRGNPLSDAAVHCMLAQCGVHAGQLFATALYQAYSVYGVRAPKALVEALGVCDATAIKYYDLAAAGTKPSLENHIAARAKPPRSPRRK